MGSDNSFRGDGCCFDTCVSTGPEGQKTESSLGRVKYDSLNNPAQRRLIGEAWHELYTAEAFRCRYVTTRVQSSEFTTCEMFENGWIKTVQGPKQFKCYKIQVAEMFSLL